AAPLQGARSEYQPGDRTGSVRLGGTTFLHASDLRFEVHDVPLVVVGAQHRFPDALVPSTSPVGSTRGGACPDGWSECVHRGAPSADEGMMVLHRSVTA